MTVYLGLQYLQTLNTGAGKDLDPGSHRRVEQRFGWKARGGSGEVYIVMRPKPLDTLALVTPRTLFFGR